MDNACKPAVLDENSEVRASVAEMLRKENDVKIAKPSWLSRKDSPKACGPMAVYVTERADATRLLEGQHFDVDGALTFARVFEPRHGPISASSAWGSAIKAFLRKRPTAAMQWVRPARPPSQRIPDRQSQVRSVWQTTRLV